MLQEKVIQAVQIQNLVTSLHQQLEMLVVGNHHLHDLIIRHLRVEVLGQEAWGQEVHQAQELVHQVAEEDNYLNLK